ncbi:MAG TPA: nuclear transport factor 2 family protein [Saprospiraceae bacterium]|nr:nuclear transport factor 2 family protein [Saprospiraceae bacterium]HNM24426.1 nuclear transport factor 2 family protein [Saprospiraceae bacterium]
MRKIFAIFLPALILASCNNQNQTSTDSTAHEKLIKQYFEYFNNHDFAKMANMYAESADFKDPSLGQGIVRQTRQQTIDKYTELAKIFPDLHDEVIQIYPSGNKHVIVEFISTGTGPDKVKFELPICTIFTIENGLITKDFTYYDNFEEEDN